MEPSFRIEVNREWLRAWRKEPGLAVRVPDYSAPNETLEGAARIPCAVCAHPLCGNKQSTGLGILCSGLLSALDRRRVYPRQAIGGTASGKQVSPLLLGFPMHNSAADCQEGPSAGRPLAYGPSAPWVAAMGSRWASGGSQRGRRPPETPGAGTLKRRRPTRAQDAGLDGRLPAGRGWCPASEAAEAHRVTRFADPNDRPARPPEHRDLAVAVVMDDHGVTGSVRSEARQRVVAVPPVERNRFDQAAVGSKAGQRIAAWFPIAERFPRSFVGALQPQPVRCRRRVVSHVPHPNRETVYRPTS
jgi:hypothetical protein